MVHDLALHDGEAVQQPSDVDRQLLGLRPWKQGAERKGMEKALLPDPTFLVDEGALHHRDLTSRAAERLQGDREPGTSGLRKGDQPSAVGTRLGLLTRSRHRDFLAH